MSGEGLTLVTPEPALDRASVIAALQILLNSMVGEKKDVNRILLLSENSFFLTVGLQEKVRVLIDVVHVSLDVDQTSLKRVKHTIRHSNRIGERVVLVIDDLDTLSLCYGKDSVRKWLSSIMNSCQTEVVAVTSTHAIVLDAIAKRVWRCRLDTYAGRTWRLVVRSTCRRRSGVAVLPRGAVARMRIRSTCSSTTRVFEWNKDKDEWTACAGVPQSVVPFGGLEAKAKAKKEGIDLGLTFSSNLSLTSKQRRAREAAAVPYQHEDVLRTRHGRAAYDHSFDDDQEDDSDRGGSDSGADSDDDGDLSMESAELYAS